MDCNEYFEIREDVVLPFWFMTITCNVTEKCRHEAPAITHVDGTARPQLISRDVNPTYFKLGGLAMLAIGNFIVT